MRQSQIDEGWLEEVERPDGVYYQACFNEESRTFDREWQAMSWLDNKRHSIRITPEGIEKWATKEVDRARALGLRLLQHQDSNSLLALEPLGTVEERITSWAIDNPIRARMLMVKLAVKIGKPVPTPQSDD